MDNSLELDESKDEAARALFDPAQVTLYALTSGLMPAAVRRRLVAHVAGAPPPQREDPPMLSGLAGLPPQEPPMLSGLAGPPPLEPTHAAMRINRLRHVVDSGPIVAYIRKPRPR